LIRCRRLQTESSGCDRTKCTISSPLRRHVSHRCTSARRFRQRAAQIPTSASSYMKLRQQRRAFRSRKKNHTAQRRPYRPAANNQVTCDMKSSAIVGGALSLLLCACGAEKAAAPNPPAAAPSPPAAAPNPPTAPAPPAAQLGTATLSWSIPIQNTDDTPLTNLTGFRVYHGTSATSLSPVRTISSPTATSTVIDNLGSGTHYFAVSAVTTSGVESQLSAIGSKAFP
jgi:hypothetical protein